jgi:hypothetical protein
MRIYQRITRGGGERLRKTQILRRIQKRGLNCTAVPARPARLLQVRLRGLGDVQVDHGADTDCIIFFPTGPFYGEIDSKDYSDCMESGCGLDHWIMGLDQTQEVSCNGNF